MEFCTNFKTVCNPLWKLHFQLWRKHFWRKWYTEKRTAVFVRNMKESFEICIKSITLLLERHIHILLRQCKSRIRFWQKSIDSTKHHISYDSWYRTKQNHSDNISCNSKSSIFITTNPKTYSCFSHNPYHLRIRGSILSHNIFFVILWKGLV